MHLIGLTGAVPDTLCQFRRRPFLTLLANCGHYGVPAQDCLYSLHICGEKLSLSAEN
jgi:hypothetical protein